MRLKQLNLIAFGQFTDRLLDLSAGPHQFHLVYGANESGKSTCMRAITSLLFGIPIRTTDNYLHDNNRLRVGATIARQNGDPITVIRRKNGKHKLYGSDDKAPVDESELSRAIGGIDEETFHQRFGMSHDQLVAGGQTVLQSKGELGTVLFAAGAGISRLKTVQGELVEASRQIFTPRSSKPKLNATIKEMADQRKELRDLQTLPTEFAELQQRLEAAEQTAETLNLEASQCRRDLDRLRAYDTSIAVVPVWRAASRGLAELENVPTLDDDFTNRRRDAAANEESLLQMIRAFEDQVRHLQTQLDGLPAKTILADYESEIVGLFQEIAAIQKAKADQNGLTRQIGNNNRHLRDALRDLDISIDPEADQSVIDQKVSDIHVSDSTALGITELAARHDSLRDRESEQRQRLETMRRQLAEIDDEIEQTPQPPDPKFIETVLSEVGSPNTLLSQVRQRTEECDDLECECRRLVGDLRLGSLAIEEAVQLPVPTLAVIDQADRAINEAKRLIESASAKRGELVEKLGALEASLEEMQAKIALPTETELLEQRNQRDRTLDSIEDNAEHPDSIRSQSSKLRVEIGTADQIVDTMRAHHQQVAQRESAARDIERTRAEIELVNQQQAEHQTAFETAEADWCSLWETIGIRPGTAGEMRDWIARHRSLVERFESLNQSRSRLKTAQSVVDRTTARLASTVQRAGAMRPVGAGFTGPESITEMGLEALHDLANQLRGELLDSARQSDQLKSRRNELAGDIPEQESAYQESAQKRAQWDRDWRAATASLSGSQSQSPSVIAARLKKLDAIRNEQRERDIMRSRIESMQADLESFAKRVTEVIQRLELNWDVSRPSTDLADALYRELQQAKSSDQQRQRLEDEIEDRQTKLAELNEQLDHESARLKRLCEEAGVSAPSDLPELERRSAEKIKLTEQLASAEKQLAMVAAGVETDEFISLVEAQDPVELRQSIEQRQAKLQELDPKCSAAQQNVGALKRELSEIDGGDRAAELNQSLQFLAAEIHRDARRYAKLRVASMILKRAIEHYRQENESPVLKIADGAFSELTCGRYSGLKPEYDEDGKLSLHGVAPTEDDPHRTVPVTAMSDGTADALYLSMRLASLEHQLTSGNKMPVIIDDCLIQLDDRRSAAALRCFSRLSLKTQVILFTHHEHLVDLAMETLGEQQCHVHYL